jgi:uncharacterized protein involved in exopolysaccharide biosynthesis
MIPVVALPVAAFGVAHVVKGNATIIANIWVSQDSTQHLPYVDPLSTPAMNVASALQQLLQTASFDVKVAQESPLYWATVVRVKDRDVKIVSDISKKVVPAAVGPDLVAITYTNKDGPTGVQLLKNILTDAPREIGRLNAQQSSSTVSYYQHQLSVAQKQLNKATTALGMYSRHHHISSADMANRTLVDPTLASMYEAVQSGQVAVHNAAQQLSQVSTPNNLGNSIQVIDAPNAQLPQTSKKQLAMDLGIGVVVGLLLSTIFIVSMTAADRSLRYPQEVTALAGLPVLVSTPRVPALERKSRRQQGKQR